MWTFILFDLIFNLVSGDSVHPLNEGDFINQNNPDRNQHALFYMKLPGVVQKRGFNKKDMPVVKHGKKLTDSLPESFDARDKWPNCPSLKEIRDQGRCGSCWAVSSVAAMTDRVCIFSNGTKQFHFSAQDLTSCSEDRGCDGGWPEAAWDYWVKKGLVSGGNFGSHEGCKPYDVPPCAHHMRDCTNYESTPKCVHSCRDGYKVSYKNDKMHGKTVYSVSGEEDMKAELYKTGPFVVIFAVYEDLANYTGGVYEHQQGGLLSAHAVKLTGWGVEEGKKYWLLVNSWGTDFGEEGYFKILRGCNECGIEENGTSGEPLLNR